MIKLGELLNTFEPGTPFVVVYKNEHQYFPSIEDLDDLIYPEALNGTVQLIWYSKSLYGAIVIEVYEEVAQ